MIESVSLSERKQVISDVLPDHHTMIPARFLRDTAFAKPLLHETDITGVRIPLELIGSISREHCPEAIREFAVRNQLTSMLMEGLEIGPGTKNSGSNQIGDGNTFYSTYETVSRIRPDVEMPALQRFEVIEYLFAQHIGSIQPILADQIMQGMNDFAGTYGKSPVLHDHGGATRRIIGNLSTLHWACNTDQSFRTLARFGAYSQIPDGVSDIPEFEKIAGDMVERFSHANMDLYGDFDPQDAVHAFGFIYRRIAELFDAEHIHFETRVARNESQHISGFEIHIPLRDKNIDRFWKPARVYGYIRNRKNANTTNEMTFLFAPKENPTEFVIKIHQIAPPGNENWSLLRTAFGIANEHGFIDVSEILLNPEPTTENNLLPKDQRNGWVDSMQLLHTDFYPDGTVRVPSPESYWAHETSIPLEYIENETDPGRLSSKISRTIRYYASKYVLGLPVSDPYTGWYAPELIPSLQAAFTRLDQLWQDGKRLPQDKIVEMLCDFAVSFQNNQEGTARLFNMAIPPHVRNRMFPILDFTKYMRIYPPVNRFSPDGLAIVQDDSTGKMLFSSGIIDFFSNLMHDVQRYTGDGHEITHQLYPIRLPNASALALCAWATCPYADIQPETSYSHPRGLDWKTNDQTFNEWMRQTETISIGRNKDGLYNLTLA